MEKKILATVGEKEITNLDVENALKSLRIHIKLCISKLKKVKNNY